jgi:hypothetical protein
MPIPPSEFKNGETKNSWEQIVYQILGDGQAYSLSDLTEEVGIISPKLNMTNKGQITATENLELIEYMLKKFDFESRLNEMVDDGRIVSKYVSQSNGSSIRYFMRKDLSERY